MTMIEVTAGVGLASAAGVAVLAQVDPMKAGEKLGTSTPSVVLGVVAVVCVGAIMYLYRRQERTEERARKDFDDHRERLYKALDAANVNTIRASAHIEANTQAMRETGQAISSQTTVLHEMERGLRDMRETVARRPCLLQDKEFIDVIRHPEKVTP